MRTVSNYCSAAVLVSVQLFLAPACMAQAKYPDTPAGNQTKALLDAFNAGQFLIALRAVRKARSSVSD